MAYIKIEQQKISSHGAQASDESSAPEEEDDLDEEEEDEEETIHDGGQQLHVGVGLLKRQRQHFRITSIMPGNLKPMDSFGMLKSKWNYFSLLSHNCLVLYELLMPC